MSAKLDISTEDLIVTINMRQLLSFVCSYLCFILLADFFIVCLFSVASLHFETTIGSQKVRLFHLCRTKE